MTWDAPSETPRDYRVAYGKDGNMVSYRNANSSVGGNQYPTTNSVSISGLDDGSYTVQVRARFRRGAGPWSSQVTARVGDPVPTPTSTPTATSTSEPTAESDSQLGNSPARVETQDSVDVRSSCFPVPAVGVKVRFAGVPSGSELNDDGTATIGASGGAYILTFQTVTGCYKGNLSLAKDSGADWIRPRGFSVTADPDNVEIGGAGFDVSKFSGSVSTQGNRTAQIWVKKNDNSSKSDKVTISQAYEYIPPCLATTGVAVSDDDGTSNLLTGADSDTLTVSSVGDSYKLNFDRATTCTNNNKLNFSKDSGADWITFDSYGSASVTNYSQRAQFTVAPYTGSDASKHGTSRTAEIWISQSNSDVGETDKVTVTQAYDFDPPIDITCNLTDCEFHYNVIDGVDGFNNSLDVSASYDVSHFSGTVDIDFEIVSGDAQITDPVQGVSNITAREHGDITVKLTMSDNMQQTDPVSVTKVVKSLTFHCGVDISPILLNIHSDGGTGVGYLNVAMPTHSSCSLPALAGSHLVEDASWITNVRVGEHDDCISATSCLIYDVAANTSGVRKENVNVQISGIPSNTVVIHQRAAPPSTTCTQMTLRPDTSKSQTYSVGGYYRGEGMTQRWTHLAFSAQGGGCSDDGIRLDSAGVVHVCGYNDDASVCTGRADYLGGNNRTDAKTVTKTENGTTTTVAEWVAIRVQSPPETCATPTFKVRNDGDSWIHLHFGCTHEADNLAWYSGDTDYRRWSLSNASLTWAKIAPPSGESDPATITTPSPTESTTWPGSFALECPADTASPVSGWTVSASVTRNGASVTSSTSATGICAQEAD